ncbi:hypothetical protein AVEN_48954-1 [Araneus ventricosus]|uniref:Uncharacterized protein n=1 Tax=Araneus ventricosus TaxID=182803 RepID=A0A4Y2AGN8_ARAVE|nr:hypothetical protein AVEN_48954-1 [Araneus ventricosus]
MLIDERNSGPDRNTEGGKRMFKAAKTRSLGCKSVVPRKKLKFDSCKKTKKPELLTLRKSAQTSKENIIQCPACDKIYGDTPSEDLKECFKYHTWRYEGFLNFEGGKFVSNFCK